MGNTYVYSSDPSGRQWPCAQQTVASHGTRGKSAGSCGLTSGHLPPSCVAWWVTNLSFSACLLTYKMGVAIPPESYCGGRTGSGAAGLGYRRRSCQLPLEWPGSCVHSRPSLSSLRAPFTVLVTCLGGGLVSCPSLAVAARGQDCVSCCIPSTWRVPSRAHPRLVGWQHVCVRGREWSRGRGRLLSKNAHTQA